MGKKMRNHSCATANTLLDAWEQAGRLGDLLQHCNMTTEAAMLRSIDAALVIKLGKFQEEVSMAIELSPREPHVQPREVPAI